MIQTHWNIMWIDIVITMADKKLAAIELELYLLIWKLGNMASDLSFHCK